MEKEGPVRMDGAVRIDEINDVLAQLLLPNSTLIRSAEKRVRKMVQRPKFVDGMLGIALSRTTALGQRQMAAIVLRKNIEQAWGFLGDDEQRQIQETLVDGMLYENIGQLRRQLALLLAEVAKLSSNFVQLDYMMERVIGSCRSGDPGCRAIAYELVHNLIDVLGEELRNHFSELVDVCASGMRDVSVRVAMTLTRDSSPPRGINTTDPRARDAQVTVQRWAVRLMMVTAQRFQHPEEVIYLQDLIDPVFAVMHSALDMDKVGLRTQVDAETLSCVLEVLTEMTTFAWPVINTERIDDMVRLAIRTARSAALDLGLREKAVLFLTELAQFHGDVLPDRQLAHEVTECLLDLMCEPPPPPPPPPADDQGPASQAAAAADGDAYAALRASGVKWAVAPDGSRVGDWPGDEGEGGTAPAWKFAKAALSALAESESAASVLHGVLRHLRHGSDQLVGSDGCGRCPVRCGEDTQLLQDQVRPERHRQCRHGDLQPGALQPRI